MIINSSSIFFSFIKYPNAPTDPNLFSSNKVGSMTREISLVDLYSESHCLKF
ncbi:unnamed protein product, partial [marine sediment metagenome]